MYYLQLGIPHHCLETGHLYRYEALLITASVAKCNICSNLIGNEEVTKLHVFSN